MTTLIPPIIKVSKGFLWIELLISTRKLKEIFCVDEWKITKEVKSGYRWLPTWKSLIVINDLCKYSTSLLMTARSNDKCFEIIQQGTIYFKKLRIFLKLLKQILQDTEKNKKKFHQLFQVMLAFIPQTISRCSK